MAEEFLKIPQIGEGLQEARIVAFLKQPGDSVARDETIYQMETDKAVMDVESPFSGTVVRLLAQPDDVLPIGTDVMVLETTEGGSTATTVQSASGQTTEDVSLSAAMEEQPSAPAPGTVELPIPQIGEGIQEARLVAKLKELGDTVKRDEIIYQMETDKAVMDVESPYAGTVVEWLANVDDVLPVGSPVLRLQTTEAVAPTAAVADAPGSTSTQGASAPPSNRQASGGARRRDLPPKTRAYAKSKGLSDDQIAALPSTGKNLLPGDVDEFLSGAGSAPAKPSTGGAKPSAPSKSHADRQLTGRQRVLASRLVRGNQTVVPGMMTVVCDWSHIEALKDETAASGGDFQPSTFTYFAYAVAKAAADHPIMRSTMVGDDTVRTFDHLQLGIAVALPEDQLVVAVVEDADSLDWKTFATNARAQIKKARDGSDQANETVTLSITNMQAYGIREAMAVVVPPGVATVFLGEVYNGLAQDTTELKIVRCANVGITIDHRLINGVGGAEFLQAIRHNVENIRELVQ